MIINKQLHTHFSPVFVCFWWLTIARTHHYYPFSLCGRIPEWLGMRNSRRVVEINEQLYCASPVTNSYRFKQQRQIDEEKSGKTEKEVSYCPWESSCSILPQLRPLPSVVEPRVWCRSSLCLLINFSGAELLQGQTLTPQQVNWAEEFRLGLALVQNCLQGVYSLTANLAQAFLRWKVAWSCIFPTSFLISYLLFFSPPLLQKETNNLLPQNLNLTPFHDACTGYDHWPPFKLEHVRDETRGLFFGKSESEIRTTFFLLTILIHSKVSSPLDQTGFTPLFLISVLLYTRVFHPASFHTNVFSYIQISLLCPIL